MYTFALTKINAHQFKGGLLQIVCGLCARLYRAGRQSIEGAWPMLSVPGILGEPVPVGLTLSGGGINHVYLSTYFSQTSSVAWHWLAGVFCLPCSQNWPTMETHYRMQLVEKNLKIPQTPTSSTHLDSSSRHCCHFVWAG